MNSELIDEIENAYNNTKSNNCKDGNNCDTFLIKYLYYLNSKGVDNDKLNILNNLVSGSSKEYINKKNNKGYTALHVSVWLELGLDVHKLLVDVCTDPNQRTNFGHNPLDIAIACIKKSENFEVIDYLLQKPKITFTKQSVSGWTNNLQTTIKLSIFFAKKCEDTILWVINKFGERRGIPSELCAIIHFYRHSYSNYRYLSESIE